MRMTLNFGTARNVKDHCNKMIVPKSKRKSNFNVTSKIVGNKLIIYINNIIHFILVAYKRLDCVSTYYDSPESRKIEVYIEGREKPYILDYDADDKWIKIIDEINKYM